MKPKKAADILQYATNGSLAQLMSEECAQKFTLGISGWGCAAGTLEPLTYTRVHSPHPPDPRWGCAAGTLEPLTYTRVHSPHPPDPRVAVFQKLLRSLAQPKQNLIRQSLII